RDDLGNHRRGGIGVEVVEAEQVLEIVAKGERDAAEETAVERDAGGVVTQIFTSDRCINGEVHVDSVVARREAKVTVDQRNAAAERDAGRAELATASPQTQFNGP